MTGKTFCVMLTYLNLNRLHFKNEFKAGFGNLCPTSQICCKIIFYLHILFQNPKDLHGLDFQSKEKVSRLKKLMFVSIYILVILSQ